MSSHLEVLRARNVHESWNPNWKTRRYPKKTWNPHEVIREINMENAVVSLAEIHHKPLTWK